MKVEHKTSPSSLHQFEDHINEGKEEEGRIFTELISAIGLQRFRFGERQRKGAYLTKEILISKGTFLTDQNSQ